MEKTSNNIINKIDKNLDEVLSIKYSYNIDSLFDNIISLSKESKNMYFEELINYYLKNIKKNGSVKILEFIRDYDLKQHREYIDYKKSFSNTLEFFSFEKESIINWEYSEKAIDITWNLLFKYMKNNIDISVNSIRNYSIDEYINSLDEDKILIYMILSLATIYKILIKMKEN